LWAQDTPIGQKPVLLGAAIDAANDDILGRDASAGTGNASIFRTKFNQLVNVPGFFANLANGTFSIAKTSGLQTALDLKETKRAGRFYVDDYSGGAALYIDDAVFTASSTAFSSASTTFHATSYTGSLGETIPGDVGKKIVLPVSQTVRQVLTIAAVTGTHSITLSSAASASSTAFPAGFVCYGPDNGAPTRGGNRGGDGGRIRK